jgi:medium-chain acyl-[acyl-carrier-protein] hydrolase
MNLSHAPETSPWFTLPRDNPRARLRLFCFPYAGGNASLFRTWQNNLPDTVEVCPVHLPGRGPRLLDPPFRRLSSMVEALTPALHPHLEKPFVFFGHSMGAMIAFETARHLRRIYGVEPVHLFISGSDPPQLARNGPPTYDLPEDEFIRELERLNGTPREVLEQSELLELIMDQLRADFEVVQTYAYQSEPPLSCGISVFGGLDDYETNRERLARWREQSTGFFSISMLPGDHFFLRTAESLLFRLLAQRLHQLVGQSLT